MQNWGYHKVHRRYHKVCRGYHKVCAGYHKMCRGYHKVCTGYHKVCRGITRCVGGITRCWGYPEILGWATRCRGCHEALEDITLLSLSLREVYLPYPKPLSLGPMNNQYCYTQHCTHLIVACWAWWRGMCNRPWRWRQVRLAGPAKGGGTRARRTLFLGRDGEGH